MPKVYIARPEHIDLAIPAVPQKLNQIMDNYLQAWEFAGAVGNFFDVSGKITSEYPVRTNAWGHLIRNGLKIQGPSGEARPSFYITGGVPYVSFSPPDYSTIAVEAGPQLVRRGKPTDLPYEVSLGNLKDIQYTAKRERCGIGFRPDGLVVYIVMPEGATIADLQTLMLEHDCWEAIAGDGGGSVSWAEKGQDGKARFYGGNRLLPGAFVMRELVSGPTEPIHRPATSGPAPWSGVLTDNLPTLRKGAKGAYAMLVQRLMAAAGIDPGPIDGDFGPKTERAVMEYQKRYKLKVDGVVGRNTWGQLARPVPISQTAGRGHKITPNFSLGEFVCKGGKQSCGGCGQVILLYLPDLCGALEMVREAIGNKPITVNSGFRCPAHNRYVGGAPASQHLVGKAADIVAAPGYAALAKAGDTALGNRGAVLQYPKKNFVHVDIRLQKTRAVME